MILIGNRVRGIVRPHTKSTDSESVSYCLVSKAFFHDICQKVCPVNNIDLGQDKKPYFKHHCEQCLACIQHCPVRALNKHKAGSGTRIPIFSWKELAKLNGY